MDSAIHPDMTLNLDVLTHIMLFLEGRHLRSIMNTCKVLHSMGVPLLLGSQVIWRKKTMPSFVLFMARDWTYRSQFLQHVTVQFGTSPGPDIGKSVTMVMERSADIRRLAIHDCEDFLRSDLKVLTSITSLQKLECLELYDIENLGETLLQHLKAPLTSLEVHCCRGSFSTDEEDPYEPGDVTALLSNFSSSLERLDVTWGVFDDTLTLPCPNVRQVSIHQCSIVDTYHLARTFPNLQELHILIDTLEAYPVTGWMARFCRQQ
ncbi:unnamed protein product [Somion occarium]|uniref:F-box domain-containing protein n=1 Tax=Somion occarium TaxID=3059160 RepID=A0ABP1E0T4_9APHY